MLKVIVLTYRRKIEAPRFEHSMSGCRHTYALREPHCIPSKLLHKNLHDSVGNADLYHIPSAYFTTMLTILPGT